MNEDGGWAAWLKFQTLPVVIYVTGKESMEMALIENLQREDLNCFRIAAGVFIH